MITLAGILLALASLAGLALGLFMAADRRTREPGVLFALWWSPALATAAGIFMRDPVTFWMGLICFVVAGIALVFERRSPRKSSKVRRPSPASERTTQRAVRTRDRAEDKTAY